MLEHTASRDAVHEFAGHEFAIHDIRAFYASYAG